MEVRETKWWVSPFFAGGWWTIGVGREKARPTAGEEPADPEAEGEEKDSECREGRAAAAAATGFEAEQPMEKQREIEEGGRATMEFFSL